MRLDFFLNGPNRRSFIYYHPLQNFKYTIKQINFHLEWIWAYQKFLCKLFQFFCKVKEPPFSEMEMFMREAIPKTNQREEEISGKLVVSSVHYYSIFALLFPLECKCIPTIPRLNNRCLQLYGLLLIYSEAS